MMMESDNIASAAFRLVHSRGRPMVEDAKMKYEDGIISEEVYKRVLSNYQAMKANLG